MSFLPFKNHLELPDISLTLFVGQLPTDINDSYVRTLLELCGRMDSWKRIVDPVTNDQTAFGFGNSLYLYACILFNNILLYSLVFRNYLCMQCT